MDHDIRFSADEKSHVLRYGSLPAPTWAWYIFGLSELLPGEAWKYTMPTPDGHVSVILDSTIIQLTSWLLVSIFGLSHSDSSLL